MPEPSDSPRAISYNWPGVGDAELARYILRTEPDLDRAVRRERFTPMLASLFMALVMAAFFAAVTHHHVPDPPWASALIGGIAAVPCLFYAGKPGGWSRFKTSLESTAYRTTSLAGSPTEPVTVTLEPEGVRLAFRLQSSLTLWEAFDRAVALPNHLAIVHAGNASGITIPLTAFTDRDEACRWLDAINARLDELGHSQAARVRAELQREPLHCGRCQHDLTGVHDPRCPECGFEPTLLTIMAWRSIARPLWSWSRFFN